MILRRHWVRRLLCVLFAVGFAGLLIEAASWGYLRLHPPTGAIGRWEFRGNHPAPYRDAAYFGPDFLRESMQCVRLSSPPGTR